MKEWLGEDSAFQETRIDGEVLYEGRIVTLKLDRVRLPSGREARREVVEHAPAAVILAENTAGELLFIRQFRYPVGKVIWESLKNDSFLRRIFIFSAENCCIEFGCSEAMKQESP